MREEVLGHKQPCMWFFHGAYETLSLLPLARRVRFSSLLSLLSSVLRLRCDSAQLLHSPTSSDRTRLPSNLLASENRHRCGSQAQHSLQRKATLALAAAREKSSGIIPEENGESERPSCLYPSVSRRWRSTSRGVRLAVVNRRATGRCPSIQSERGPKLQARCSLSAHSRCQSGRDIVSTR